MGRYRRSYRVDSVELLAVPGDTENERKYLSAWKNIIWCPSLVPLEIFQIYNIGLLGAIIDWLWKGIFLHSRVRHRAVVI